MFVSTEGGKVLVRVSAISAISVHDGWVVAEGIRYELTGEELDTVLKAIKSTAK